MVKLCSHLQQLEKWLLTQPDLSVTYEQDGRRIILNCSKPLDLAHIKSQFDLPSFIGDDEDPYQSLQGSLFCTLDWHAIHWPVDPKPIPPLCEHLAPVVAHLLRKGNVVESREVYLWERRDLVLNFRDVVDLEELKRTVPTVPALHSWENHDGHYELQRGLACDEHRQTVAWPLR